MRLRLPLLLILLLATSSLSRAADSDSTAVDDTALAPAWGENSVFYHLYVDRFRDGDPRSRVLGQAPWDSLAEYSSPDSTARRGGDFVGLKEGLSYLEDLGVDGVIFDGFWQSEDPLGPRPLNFFETEPHQGSNKYFHTTVTDARLRDLKVLLGCRWLEAGARTSLPPEQADFGRRLSHLKPGNQFPVSTPGVGGFLDQLMNVWVRYQGPDGLWVYGASSPAARDTLSSHLSQLVHQQRLSRKLILWSDEPIISNRTTLELLERLCRPGRVVLEYGEELGLWDKVSLTDHGEPELGFERLGADPSFPRTMAWSPGRQDLARLERVRRVLKARREHPALVVGELEVPAQDSSSMLRWFIRRTHDEIVIAAFNIGPAQQVNIPVSVLAVPTRPAMILGDPEGIHPPGSDGSRTLELPSGGAWIGAFRLAP